jgi:hypothetical protein
MKSPLLTRPGNLIFRSGSTTGTPMSKRAAACGDIIFELGDGTECLRFTQGGVAVVRGEVVEDNRTVYESLKKWLADAKILRSKDMS